MALQGRNADAPQLNTIGSGWPSWSRDGEYLHFEDNPGIDWDRVRIKDRKVERVMSLTGLKMDAGGIEIYARDWEAP